MPSLLSVAMRVAPLRPPASTTPVSMRKPAWWSESVRSSGRRVHAKLLCRRLLTPASATPSRLVALLVPHPLGLARLAPGLEAEDGPDVALGTRVHARYAVADRVGVVAAALRRSASSCSDSCGPAVRGTPEGRRRVRVVCPRRRACQFRFRGSRGSSRAVDSAKGRGPSRGP
jgi:hypothetical protein